MDIALFLNWHDRIAKVAIVSPAEEKALYASLHSVIEISRRIEMEIADEVYRKL